MLRLFINNRFLKVKSIRYITCMNMCDDIPQSTLYEKIKKEMEETGDLETKQSKDQMMKFYEPAYLKLLLPPTPHYHLLNLQLQGYDFAVLEEYTRYVQKLLKLLQVQLNDYWPLPRKSLQYKIYENHSKAFQQKYVLEIYQRVLQIKNIEAYRFPIVIQMLLCSKPKGVFFSIHKHTKQEADNKYIQDEALKHAKKELIELVQPISVLQIKGII